MQITELTTNLLGSDSELTSAPSTSDRWLAIHWVSHGVASVATAHKPAAVRGAIDGMYSVLPPVPKVRRAVFYSRRASEVR